MKRKMPAGFTIIELMITIIVAATLLVIGVPSMRSMILNNRLTTQANTFIGDLSLARLESIKRRRNVYITATTPVVNNEFGGGWTVWADADGDGIRDAGEDLRITQAGPTSMTLDSTTGVNPIQFNSSGGLNSAVSIFFNLCDDRTGETGRQISISVVGRVSLNRQYVCP